MPVNRAPNPALARLAVAPIRKSAAKRVVLAQHYMGTFPQGSTLHFGVLDGRRLVGVAVFGYSSATEAKVGRLVPGLERSHYLEMQRLWVSDDYGHSTESWVLGQVMRLLRQHTATRLVVTHAGGCKNDCGIVYQASAWLYFGRTRCRDFYLTEGGQYRSLAAALRFRRPGTQGMKPLEVAEHLFGAGEIVDSWRYLYAYPIHKGIRRRLQPLTRPFPKDSERHRFDQAWVD